MRLDSVVKESIGVFEMSCKFKETEMHQASVLLIIVTVDISNRIRSTSVTGVLEHLLTKKTWRPTKLSIDRH